MNLARSWRGRPSPSPPPPTPSRRRRRSLSLSVGEGSGVARVLVTCGSRPAISPVHLFVNLISPTGIDYHTPEFMDDRDGR